MPIKCRHSQTLQLARDEGYNDGLYDVLKEAKDMVSYDMTGLERYEDDMTITIRQLKQIVKKLKFEEVL